VMNAVGDVIDYDGKILAGAVTPEGKFFAEQDPLIRWQAAQIGLSANTVLSAVMVNANITKQQAYFLAERAHFGIARRVDPSHTSFDGDVVFVISVPEIIVDMDYLSSLVVKCMEKSVIDSVLSAKSMFGLTSYEDLKKEKQL